MKKIFMAAMFFFVFAATAGASSLEGFYLGGSLGAAGSDNFDTLQNQETALGNSTDLEESNFSYGIQAGYEKPLINEQSLLGIRIGVDWYSDVSLEIINDAEKNTSNGYSIPVTVYYKYLLNDSKIAFLGGLGLTFINMTLNEKDTTTGDSIDYDDSKTCPHITAGVEYRFSELFALSLDFKYAINAEIKRNGTKRDLGFQGALAARFYL
ncbi:MAG: outer membrane beta-barrel protein [Endomicrobiaceae bacterium]